MAAHMWVAGRSDADTRFVSRVRFICENVYLLRDFGVVCDVPRSQNTNKTRRGVLRGRPAEPRVQLDAEPPGVKLKAGRGLEPWSVAPGVFSRVAPSDLHEHCRIAQWGFPRCVQ